MRKMRWDWGVPVGLTRAAFVRVLAVMVVAGGLGACGPGLWGQTTSAASARAVPTSAASQAAGQVSSSALPVLHVENGPNSEHAKAQHYVCLLYTSRCV